MKFDAMQDPMIREWSSKLTPPGTPSQYLRRFVRPTGLLAIAQIVFPRLTVREGLVFVAPLLERLGAEDPPVAQAAVNRLPVADTFPVDGPRSAASDRLAADFIACCWRLWSAIRLPQHPVEVTVAEDPTLTVILVNASPGATSEAASDLPAFYRWGVPEHGSIDFDPKIDDEYLAWLRTHTAATSADFLSEELTVSGMAALAHVSMPTLIEVDDHVLIEWKYKPDTYAGWKSSLDGDSAAIERAVNNYVVWDSLGGSDTTDDIVDDLCAEFIALCWRYWFHDQYPDRRFQVSIVDQYGPTVTVHEIRG